MATTKTRFQRLMKNHSISQSKLATRMGCSQAYISLIMNGERDGMLRPRLAKRLEKLERA